MCVCVCVGGMSVDWDYDDVSSALMCSPKGAMKLEQEIITG